ncbi:MAG: hypothetical protein KC877_00795 [Candidatus Kaiserbacteria bacterium]|nr:hypothetical protein [Candidatus Kaiserbacteria bacterium]MCB9816256.1 hypothetical protein [Candidatus Nomurabacteria bacterium]
MDISNVIKAIVEYLSSLHLMTVTLYSLALPFFVTLGVLLAKELVKFSFRKKYAKYQREADDVKELHTKIHDRLTELLVNFERKEQNGIRLRLKYAAARVKKYDKKTAEDIERLAEVLANHTAEKELEPLVLRISEQIDKLWAKKC